MALIGAVALIVIGPEKLPRVARTVGTLLGKAQRYVADVKAEVSRSMELEELKKMKETVETAARDVHQSVQTAAVDFESSGTSTPAGSTPATHPQGGSHHRLSTDIRKKSGVSNKVPCRSGTKPAMVCVPKPCQGRRAWRVTVPRNSTSPPLQAILPAHESSRDFLI